MKEMLSDEAEEDALKYKEFRLPVAKVKRIIPTNAKAIPIEQIKTYFQAASIECFVL